MTSERETTRIVRSWLEVGADRLPDRVLDSVLEQLPAHRQRRRPLWRPRRFTYMNRYAKVAIAAAAVLVVAVLGYNMLPGNGPGDEATPTPIVTPTPSPTPGPTTQVLGDGSLHPGTVVARLGPDQTISATFTVPNGWRGFDGSCLLPVLEARNVGICFPEFLGFYSDPCRASSRTGEDPVGPSVEDLATALTEQTAYEATTPTDVTLGGYTGKGLDLHLPTDVASCEDGAFYPWAGSIYAQGPDNLWHVWILDVQGERQIVISNYFASTSSDDQAEMQAIVDSIQFTR
jgi:hypothetical protein